MDEHRAPLRTRLGRAAAAAVPLAFLVVFFVWPLAAILERSLVADGRVDLPFDVLTRRSTIEVAWFTLWQAVVSTGLTLIAGLPFAWAIARFSFPGRRLAEALVLVPFVLPTVVVATALLAVLPTGLEGTVWAILLAHVFFNVAVVVRIVGSFWSELDDRVWDVAGTLGAGPWRRLRTVTLPLLTPALAASSAVVFIFSFTSFGIVVILGGPRYATLEAEIYNQAARIFDLRTAAALSLLQLAAVTAAVVVAGRLEVQLGGGRRSRSRPRPRPVGRQRVTVAAVVIGTLTLLAVPVAALVERSLSVSGGHGLGNFRALARETPALLVAPWHAIVNSLIFAGTATAIALAVGLPAAMLATGGRGRTVGGLVMLPLGASAAMLGFGFLLAFDTPPIDLRASPWLVPLAQSLVAVPFVVRTIAPALRSIDDRLREAAAVLGASPARVRREIELPLMARAVGVAAAIAFAIALGEFGATVFVARADWPTLPVAVFRFLGRPGSENVGQAMALSVTLMALTVVVALAVERATALHGVAAVIRVDGVDVTLGGKPILRGIDLHVAEGETLALLGPSGSGKSTLLRVVAGLQRPCSGRVDLAGRDVTELPAHRRGVGLVFQDAVLFPHRDVGRNVAFGLVGQARAESDRRVAELLELVGLAGLERRSVGTLSGGEAQRVALARALAPAPRVLLLDEPLGSLDGPLRDRLQADLRELFAQLSLTVIHVTHDVGEAFALGRRVAVLRDGRIAQVATPDELWRRPADEWVARFLGMRNVLDDDGRLAVVRPEAVHVQPGEGATVIAAERRGPVVLLTVRRDDGVELEAATTELEPPRSGDRVRVSLDEGGVVDVRRDEAPS